MDGRSALEALTALREPLGRLILLDIANAVDDTFDLIHADASHAARIQDALPDTHFVKSLTTLWVPSAEHDQIDLGDITTAAAVEHDFVLSTRLRLTFGDAAVNIAVVRRSD